MSDKKANVSNIHNYRRAKKIVPEIEQTLVYIQEAITKFSKYKHYISVLRILEVLGDNQIILKGHLAEHKKIIETKGAVE